jgi:phosphoribosylanthranilate isomerase
MPYRLRVKICGITTADDLAAAIAAGADAVGLNFHPPSPRWIDADRAREILAALPPFVEAVGVFVSRPVAEARHWLAGLGPISTIQMHAGQPERLPAPFRIIPAFPVRTQADLTKIEAHIAQANSSAVLVDGHAPGLHGGTGQTAPWELLAEWRPGVPVILAGGLTPENVAEAVRRVRPYAVDVASGVELKPGQKCPELMRRFIEAARAAAAELATAVP